MTDDRTLAELRRWLEDVGGRGWLWSLKYVSANDTYAKRNVHQGGPYVAKDLLAAAFPQLSARALRESNPDLAVHATVDSHGTNHDLRLVWYNSRRLSGQTNGRDEARLTRWGGMDSPMVSASATGSLAVFAFRISGDGDSDSMRVWLCSSPEEEDLVTSRVGDVEPGSGLLVDPRGLPRAAEIEGNCALAPHEIPAEWLAAFPSGEEIVQWVIGRRPLRGEPPDQRLVSRRECEYAVFRSIEHAHVMPMVREGFPTVDAFIVGANEVLNRRKSRSGRSLELQVRAILREDGVAHAWGATTEDKRKPDFIFPSIEKYRDGSWPAADLYMLAAKTTCKDRWRQILNEADRIETKHLLTLQEGVSGDQHKEMVASGVQLVVPARLVSKYPDEVQEKLMTFEQFLNQVRSTQPAA